MHFHRGRHKRFHALISQSPLDRFFVARSGVQRVPAQFFLRYKLAQPAAHFVALIGTTHSFALWVPWNWFRLTHTQERMRHFQSLQGEESK